jgi:hypothetical protein
VHFLIILLLVFFLIGGFFAMNWFCKLLVLAYVGAVLYVLSIISARDEGLFLFKALMGGFGWFVFLFFVSSAEAGSERRGVIRFFLTYGGLYLFTVTLMKFAFFLSYGSTAAAWDDADVMVTVMPYKWVVFIVVVVLFEIGKDSFRRWRAERSSGKG